MITPSEIAQFIQNDSASTKKRLAKVGLDYYEGRHDIRNYKIFYIDASGEVKEDKTKSNIRISHPFFTEIVDQIVPYLLSGEDGFVKSDDPALQGYLDEYFNNNDEFMAELADTITGVQAKGFDWMFAKRDENGKTCFQWADCMGVVECEPKYTSDHRAYIIYWYEDRTDKDGNKIYNIRVYDDAGVYFFTRVNEGGIIPDKTVKPNPQPHSTYQDGNPGGLSYGFIPFFRMDNNKKQVSALPPVKDLIDDYDLMNAGLSNNIQDTNEALYVVRGFQGDNLDELMTNIRAKKHIGVDEDGGVDVQTVDIPVEARKTKMEVDEKNIYRFGFALNTAGLKDTAATTNLAIQSAYSLLELRAKKLENRLKPFLRKLVGVVLAEVNEENGTDYQQKDVYFEFEREIPTNAQEIAQIELVEAQRKQTEITTILNLAGTIDDETKLQLICEQLDLDFTEVKDKVPKPEENATAEAQAALGGIQPEGDAV
jgi:SPP1 family phage portal protein